MAEEKSRDAWEKADALASIASKLLIPVILVVATSLLSRGLQERQAAVSEGDLSRQWVQLALSVLQDEKMAGQTDMRTWSVAVINHNLPDAIKMPTNLRDGLVAGSVSLPGSTPWSISGPSVELIQSALNAGNLCDDPLFADGLAGFATRHCLSRFLGGAPDTEVQGLLSREPDLLRGWVEAGAPPADWRDRAGAALAAPPLVAVMPPDWRPYSSTRRTLDAPATPAAEPEGAADPVARIQAALRLGGDCGVAPDGVVGMMTVACVAGYLGDASADEARALLSTSPVLLLEWIEAGEAPADWRAQTTALR